MLELAQRNDVKLAMLIRGGISVISQRDFRTLGTVFAHPDRPDLAPPNALDHHESDWYRRHFGPT
jgi:hypothetical protein